MKIVNITLALLLSTTLVAQNSTILPGQKSAIRSLATTAGFSIYELWL